MISFHQLYTRMLAEVWENPRPNDYTYDFWNDPEHVWYDDSMLGKPMRRKERRERAVAPTEIFKKPPSIYDISKGKVIDDRDTTIVFNHPNVQTKIAELEKRVAAIEKTMGGSNREVA